MGSRSVFAAVFVLSLLAACTSASGSGSPPPDPPREDAQPADLPVEVPSLPDVAPPSPDVPPPLDAPTPLDAPPPPDVPVACGAEGMACCASGDPCAAGLSCCGGGCVNTSNSPAHCGACGRPCNLPNANERCASGACALTSCAPGFGDCDADASNGCEANLSASVAHCGACGRACGVGQVCSDGSCQSRCARGQADCNGACVDTQTSASHCGACGRACNLPNAAEACAAGACVVARCDAGFADCDGNPANGCETDTRSATAHCGACGRACAAGQVCSNGACATRCAGPGLMMCGAACVDTRSNAAHCGACNRACAPANGVGACTNGACGIARCNAGFANCDGMAANGCETSTSTALAHCGACGRACNLPNATGSCTNGTCGIARCNAGFGDCDGMAANGCETSTSTALAHCGACGRACNLPNATETCSAGACAVMACSAGFGNCDGMAANGCETNLSSTPAHCGACGRACPAGQVCSNGTCTVTCGAGQTLCAGRCINLQSDASHCGMCGRVCNLPNANEGCAAGTCTVASCLAGFANCDANAANGCEVDTRTNVAHCGMCGRACNLPNTNEGCANGACTVASCTAGFGNCDNNPANGCETALATTAAHCGACGRACNLPNANESCASGTCTVASCTAGFGNCDNNPANGCEVDTRTNVAHCGMCGRACNLPNANEGCANGACTVASCLAGYGNCDGVATNGCETSLQSSNAHCGACGRACPAGQVCSNGACTVTCGAGLTLCGGACVNLQTSTAHCGACGRACAPANGVGACANGACGVARCNAGYGNCDMNPANGCETNTNTTVGHCGACGRACAPANAAGSCTNGACGVASCSAGFANCDMNPANGCEVDTRSNVGHCGACGRGCNLPNANEGCAAGMCTVASCVAGFGNCDGMATNGCETNLQSSNTHCGACGRACPAGQTCASGTCAPVCGTIGELCCGTMPYCRTGDNCRRPNYDEPFVCCNEAGRPCTNDFECCGQMLCGPGRTCVVRRLGESCSDLRDCAYSGAGGDPILCERNTTSRTQPVCCKLPTYFLCASDAECCGLGRCAAPNPFGGRACTCQELFQPCLGMDCCTGLFCNSATQRCEM